MDLCLVYLHTSMDYREREEGQTKREGRTGRVSSRDATCMYRQRADKKSVLDRGLSLCLDFRASPSLRVEVRAIQSDRHARQSDRKTEEEEEEVWRRGGNGERLKNQRQPDSGRTEEETLSRRHTHKTVLLPRSFAVREERNRRRKREQEQDEAEKSCVRTA